MKIKFYLTILLLALFCLPTMQAENAPPPAPLPDGVIAPNWTLTDINGFEHTLYDYLDAGIDVILDFSATWCGPCWNYHQTHILADIYNASEAMVIMIESDLSTPESCIYGNCGNTIGNWTIGTPYPIINLEGAGASVNGDYNISYYPTVYGIAAYNKKIYEVGQASRASWQRWLLQSFQLKETAAPVISDVACYGENNGSIDVTITGGYVNRNYRWNTGATTQDLSNLAPGDYFLTVTEGQGHSIEQGPYTVAGPSSPTSVIPEQIIENPCTGYAAGAIVVAGTGGTPGYSYLWSTGDTGPAIASLVAGTYTVTVTDARGCTGREVMEVVDPPLLELAVNVRNENCGNGDGELLLFGFGGNPGYLYDIGFGPLPTSEYTNMSAGAYFVTISDANGCTSVETAIIENTPSPVVDAGEDTNIPCDTSAVMLDASNSSSGSGFVYVWTSPNGNIVQGDSSLMPVVDTAGTYVLKITNVNSGCTDLDTVMVSEIADRPTADAGVDKTLTCAAIDLELDGSDSSSDTLSTYTYLWSGPSGHILEGDSTLMPRVDTVGEYILEVTNTVNGCVSVDTVAVGLDRTAPDAEAGNSDELTCLVNALSLDGSGSSTDTLDIYDYQWSSSAGNIVSGDTTLSPEVDASGVYVLEVTNSVNGCVSIDSVTIIDNTVSPIADAGLSSELNCSIPQLLLDGSNSSTGGNFSYLWNTPNGNINSGQNTLSPNVDAAGTYILEVTNNDNGCSSTAAVEVTQDTEAPTAHAGNTAELNCNISQLTLDGSNSSTGNNFSYLWNTANGNISSGQNTLYPSILAAGTYTLEVTNNDNGCSSMATVEVTQDIEEPIADAGANAELNCGISQLTLNGSNSSTGNNFSYLWNTANGNISSGQNTLYPNILAAGTYTLEVTNNDNGCSSVATVEVTQDDEAPTADAGATAELNCNITQLVLDGSSSSAGSNFSYVWNTTDGNINSGENTLYPSIDAPGTYTLDVTNGDNNCTSTSSVVITEAPALDIALATQTNNPCNNATEGTASVAVNGGTGDYNYNWSNGNTTATATNLAAGTYQVVVSDQVGCTASFDVTISEPSALMVTTTATDETADGANNGTATATVNGGTAPYSYLWNNGSTTASIGNLEPGIYNLVITDVNGCKSEVSITVNSFNCTIDGEAIASDVSCNGAANGSASVTLTAGEGPYTFMWSNGLQTASINNLSPGTYSVTATDNNNCPFTANIVVDQPTVISVNLDNQTDVTCFGEANGSANLSASGGTGTLTYEWPNGSTLANRNDLTAGSYTVNVSDANGCSIQSIIVIDEPTALNTTEISSDESAMGANDGTATVTASGGTPPYQYQWSNAATTATVSGLAPGTYTVQVLDNNNCSETKTIVIKPYDCSFFNANAESNAVSCTDANDGQAMVIPSGGIPPYNYQWSSGGTTAMQTGLAAGTYTVSITDGGNCPSVVSITIENPTPIEVNVSEQQHIDCFGNTNGSISVAATGGTGTLSYLWPSGNTEATETNLAAGTYEVMITDANGCMSTKEVTLTQPSELQASINEQQNVQCVNDQSGMASIDIQGGTPPYLYNWSNGASSATVDGLAAGSYTSLVTDQNGCTTQVAIEIVAEDDTAPVAIAQDLTIYLDENGIATLDAAAIDNGSSDNCGISGMSIDRDNFSCSELGTQMVVLTITDLSGNSHSANAQVTVVDNIAPSIVTCPSNIEVTNCDGLVTYQLPEAMDNCEVISPLLMSGLGSGANFPEGTTEEVYEFTDQAGNTIRCSFFVTVVNTLQATVSGDEEVCFGDANATATVAANGGNAGYSYTWSNGQTGAQASNLAAGTYTVVIADAGGCEVTRSITIVELPELGLATEQLDNEVCFGETDGMATVAANGGSPGYTYVWSDGQMGAAASNLAPGTYTVNVMDAKGCEVNRSITIVELPELGLATEQLENEVCFGETDGMATVAANGGSPGYTYVWSDGQMGAAASNLAPGTYTVNVMDAKGCEASSTITVVELPELGLSVNEVIDEVGMNGLGSIDITVNGGTPPYEYFWSNNGTFISNTEDLIDFPAGEYLLEVVDSKGCLITSETITIDNLTSLNDPELAKQVRLFPNPSSGQLYLEMNFQAADEIDLTLYDAMGRVLPAPLSELSYGQRYQLNLNQYPAGVYWLRIRIDGSMASKRIVLSR